MSPKISILYLTYRPGGYDMLSDYLEKQTFKDYELICVDERVDLHKDRLAYLKSKNIPNVKISPSKKKCFPDTSFNLINAYNTGVLLSEGRQIIIINDYTLLYPDSLEYLDSLYTDNDVLNMSGLFVLNKREMILKDTYINEPISIWTEPWSNEHMTKDPYFSEFFKNDYELWIGRPMELFYTAFPYELLVKMNGFPECYDSNSANQEKCTYLSVVSAGGKVVTEVSKPCLVLNHRDWGGGLWHQSKKTSTNSNRLILRENTFNLETHVRGTLPMGLMTDADNPEVF